jgi:hypothetical protein
MFAPHLRLKENEKQYPPFKQLSNWHAHCRKLGERVSSNECLKDWYRDADIDPTKNNVTDIVTLMYMTQVFHNLESNDLFSSFNFTPDAGDAYFSSLVAITAAQSTNLPWLMITSDVSELAPEEFGDFYQTLPNDERGPPLLRSSGMESSTAL